MPEAAVNKDSEAVFRKYKIGFAEYISASAPTRNPVAPQQHHQSQFGGFIAPIMYSRHYLGTLPC
jgi:hypothetical protein